MLAELLETHTEKSILLTEKEKMDWVEATYEALELGNNNNFDIDTGSYLKDYYKTLEILDHGYCSDKRRDAMKLFRDVSDIQGIPQQLISQFESDISKWIITSKGEN